jgi:hypothetical protein
MLDLESHERMRRNRSCEGESWEESDGHLDNSRVCMKDFYQGLILSSLQSKFRDFKSTGEEKVRKGTRNLLSAKSFIYFSSLFLLLFDSC